MIINFTENFKFTTRLKLKDENVEVVTSTKLLGTMVQDDLKWDLNTSTIVKKANARMELLRRVASFGTPAEDLKTVYILFVRSLLEQSATVWHSGLSQENIQDLERVQKTAIKIILQEQYQGYKQGLAQLDLQTLESRREKLCLNCHSPTQPQLELELDLVMGRKPPPHPTTGTFKALPGNLGS